MRASTGSLRRMFALPTVAMLVVAGLWLVTSGSASAAAPTPCGGNAHITDATGDGHHVNTDITSAWFSEDETGLRVVIKTGFGDWQPAHDDSDGAGWVFLFRSDAATRYLRLHAPFPWDGLPVYDFGTWTQAGGFVRQGTTTGSVTTGVGGTVTIEVPDAIRLVKGAVLTQTQVLTYDGSESGTPHWVDRAPGGTTPAAGSYGADFVVGSCLPKDPDDPDPDLTTAVQLSSKLTRTGRGPVKVSGGVLPARSGVAVDLTVSPSRGSSSRTIRLVTGSDGSFSSSPVVAETSVLRAVATDSGIGSRSLTVTMRSKVSLKLSRKVRVHRSSRGKRIHSSVGRAFGAVDPALPGRILILPVDGIFPVAKAVVRKGRFSVRSKRIRRGRYQAVFIPERSRAERATSKTGKLK